MVPLTCPTDIPFSRRRNNLAEKLSAAWRGLSFTTMEHYGSGNVHTLAVEQGGGVVVPFPDTWPFTVRPQESNFPESGPPPLLLGGPGNNEFSE